MDEKQITIAVPVGKKMNAWISFSQAADGSISQSAKIYPTRSEQFKKDLFETVNGKIQITRQNFIFKLTIPQTTEMLAVENAAYKALDELIDFLYTKDGIRKLQELQAKFSAQ